MSWPLRTLWFLLAALSLLVALRLANGLAEMLFDSGLLAALVFGLTWFFSYLPLASADLLLGIAALLLLFLLWRLVRALRARRRRWRRLAELGAAVAWVVILFVLQFGVIYARPAVEDRWALPSSSAAELDSTATQLVLLTNQAYRNLHGSDDAGQPTQRGDEEALEEALELSLRVLCVARGEATHLRWARPKARQPLVSPLMDRFGLSGFYFPWSGEANVNRGLPAISFAHALAHEKAHQRGFAPEDEANFIAVLVGLSSGNPLSRYAELLFAQRQALNALAREDIERVRALVAQRVPGVQRDVDDVRAYWEQFRGPMQDFAHRSNDAYLRLQQVEGGVRSYQGSLELLLRAAAEDPSLFQAEGDS